MQNVRVYSHQPTIDHDALGRITQNGAADSDEIRIPAPGSKLHGDRDYLAQLQRRAETVSYVLTDDAS